jgi:hypothetical protein
MQLRDDVTPRPLAVVREKEDAPQRQGSGKAGVPGSTPKSPGRSPRL